MATKSVIDTDQPVRPTIVRYYPVVFRFDATIVPDEVDPSISELNYTLQAVFLQNILDKATGEQISSTVIGKVDLNNAEISAINLLAPLRRAAKAAQDKRIAQNNVLDPFHF